MKKPTRLMTIAQVAEAYPVFTETAWRVRFYRKQYGIESCIIKLNDEKKSKRGSKGKRRPVSILIDADKLEEWLDSKRLKASYRGKKTVIVRSLKSLNNYLIPKIANNKDVGEIPANTAKFFDLKLKEWINENLSGTKNEKTK